MSVKDFLTAEQAAEKLGYEYSYFRRLLKQGRVPGAIYWHGYAIPKDVGRGDVKPNSEKSSENIEKNT